MPSRKPSRPVQAELLEIVARLRQLQPTLAVAISALRQQNADVDADVADLLQHSVSDTLREQLEKLEALQARLPGSAARRR